MASYKSSIKKKTGKSYCITTRKQEEAEKKNENKNQKKRKKKPRNIIKKRGKYEPKLFQLFKLF